MSVNNETMTATIGRRLQAMAGRLRRSATPHPGFYGRLAGQTNSADGAGGLNKTDDSTEAATAAQAWLPIGPSCC